MYFDFGLLVNFVVFMCLRCLGSWFCVCFLGCCLCCWLRCFGFAMFGVAVGL